MKVVQRNEAKLNNQRGGDDSWSQEKDVSSEDSQREALSLDSGSKETSQHQTIAEEASSAQDNYNQNTDICSESETDSGTPVKKPTNNVTVVNVSSTQSDAQNDTQPSLSKLINEGSERFHEHIHKTVHQQHSIPHLPKPTSSRSERTRQLQNLHESRKFEPNPGDSTSSSTESIKAGEQRPSKLKHSIHQVEVLEEPTNCLPLVDESVSHVTVIQVGANKNTITNNQPISENVKGAKFSGSRKIPLDTSVSLESSDKRAQNQRLGVDKNLLRETRSLDESRHNGTIGKFCILVLIVHFNFKFCLKDLFNLKYEITYDFIRIKT